MHLGLLVSKPFNHQSGDIGDAGSPGVLFDGEEPLFSNHRILMVSQKILRVFRLFKKPFGTLAEQGLGEFKGISRPFQEYSSAMQFSFREKVM